MHVQNVENILSENHRDETYKHCIQPFTRLGYKWVVNLIMEARHYDTPQRGRARCFTVMFLDKAHHTTFLHDLPEPITSSVPISSITLPEHQVKLWQSTAKGKRSKVHSWTDPVDELSCKFFPIVEFLRSQAQPPCFLPPSSLAAAQAGSIEQVQRPDLQQQLQQKGMLPGTLAMAKQLLHPDSTCGAAALKPGYGTGHDYGSYIAVSNKVAGQVLVTDEERPPVELPVRTSVEIYWADDCEWYRGQVVEVVGRGGTLLHKVACDDGDVEVLDMRKQRFKVVPQNRELRGLQAGVAPSSRSLRASSTVPGPKDRQYSTTDMQEPGLLGGRSYCLLEQCLAAGVPPEHDVVAACRAHGHGTKMCYDLLGNMLAPPLAACLFQKLLPAIGVELPKGSQYGKFPGWHRKGVPAKTIETEETCPWPCKAPTFKFIVK